MWWPELPAWLGWNLSCCYLLGWWKKYVNAKSDTPVKLVFVIVEDVTDIIRVTYILNMKCNQGRNTEFFMDFWGLLQLMFDCRWYARLLTRTVDTPLALCEAWGGAVDVTGRLLIAMARRLIVEVRRRRCCLETAGSVLALHWGSLGQACCSVKPDEVRELIWLVPT
jgi:hypothetical protein